METINLTVSGMTCGACVKHVEKAINSIAYSAYIAPWSSLQAIW